MICKINSSISHDCAKVVSLCGQCMEAEHRYHSQSMMVPLVLLLAAALALLVYFQPHRPKNFPPGPPPIPLFGNLLELHLENPIADLERVSTNNRQMFVSDASDGYVG